jgi:hypothetical protein
VVAEGQRLRSIQERVFRTEVERRMLRFGCGPLWGEEPGWGLSGQVGLRVGATSFSFWVWSEHRAWEWLCFWSSSEDNAFPGS